MSDLDPSVARRRLRVELKQLRTAANFTQRDVAERLDWSSSKVIRIEAGSVSVSTTDLLALLRLYGMPDEDSRYRTMTALARASRRQRFSEYRGLMASETIQYFGYESAASIIRQFEPTLVPGLLQTEEYARVVLRDIYGYDPDQMDKLVEAREERQELLDRESPPEMFYILGESVSRYLVGGHSVMRRQIEHIQELDRKNAWLSVQILPFSAGAHPGMKGPFIYIEFPDANDDDILYLEDVRGGTFEQFRDKPETTSPYLQTFLDLERLALTRDETKERLQLVRDRLASTSEIPTGQDP